MTASYHLKLASVSSLGFLGVLFRWKSSVWKHVYKELFIWTTTYLVLSFFYRSHYFLNAKQKQILENLSRYFNERLEYVPLTFILGFFVNTILSRWFEIFNNMGYIESYAIYICNCLRGEDEETKQLRRTLVRYLCLSQVLVLRDISVQVRKRFPTIESVIDAGILLKEEKEQLDLITLHYNKYWVPVRWIFALILKAWEEGKITSDLIYCKICDEVDQFRYNLQFLCNYDWVPLPLVYPQAVFLAVYVYFTVCLISRQFIVADHNSTLLTNDVDLILPLMTMIQLVFFIGWLKVAQALLNPFGDDDDDFKCNYLIDKNLVTGVCIADNYNCAPDVQPDLFWQRQKAPPVSEEMPLVGSSIKAKLCSTRSQSQMTVRQVTHMPSPLPLESTKSQRILQKLNEKSEQLRQTSPKTLSNFKDEQRLSYKYNFKFNKRQQTSLSICIGELKQAKDTNIPSSPYNYSNEQIKLLQSLEKVRKKSDMTSHSDTSDDFVPPDPEPMEDIKIEITRL